MTAAQAYRWQAIGVTRCSAQSGGNDIVNEHFER
jgi:hypothetical protein